MSRTLSCEGVAWNRDGAVVEIVLDSPPTNALRLETVSGLQDAMDYIQAVDAEVVVVASAVDGFFASGAEDRLMSALDPRSHREHVEALHSALQRLADLPVISIAAIDGRVVTAGLELASACTMRVAARHALLARPEADATPTARPMWGDEAFQLGLVDRLADANTTARSTAWRLACEMTATSTPTRLAMANTAVRARHTIERSPAISGLHHSTGKRALALAGAPGLP